MLSITLSRFVCKQAEVVTSCIIHYGMARKLGKYSYIENKEAASQGIHLTIFMYFLATNCWEGVLIKMGVVNWLKLFLLEVLLRHDLETKVWNVKVKNTPYQFFLL